MIQNRQIVLERIVLEYMSPPMAPGPVNPTLAIGPADDNNLLERARRAANSAKFRALFEQGDISAYGGDDSAADLALCAMLAFWTPDPAQIDRLMRSSALYRPKWERRDYRERTIARALAGTRSYAPSLPSGTHRAVRIVPPSRDRRPIVELSAVGTRHGR